MTGLIRPARRPADFVARGPAPRAPFDLIPGEGEDLCFLTGDWRIFQKRRGHRWSLDDLVTAWLATRVVQGRAIHAALDLGCGIGSVLMMVAWALPRTNVTGIEAQPASAALARRSLTWNGADDRCRVLDGDLRDAGVLPADARFDLITGTPPYFAEDEGVVSDVAQRAACRFEQRGGVDDYCAAAARWLAPGGLFTVCASSTQRDEVARAARTHGFGLVRQLDVSPKEGKPPLVSVFALDRSTAAAAPERLVVRTAEGQWTNDFRTLRTEMGMPDRPPRRPKPAV